MSPPILFLAGLFLIVAIAGGIVGAAQLDAASAAQNRIVSAREHLDELMRVHFGQATGLHEYLSTHERSFLELSAARGESFDDRIGVLDGELANAHLPEARTEAAALRALHARWVNEAELPLLADPDPAVSLQLQSRDKALTDEMRRRSFTMRALLRTAYDAVGRELHWRINATGAASVGTVAILACVTLALGLSRASALQALVREQSLVSALQQTLRVDGTRLARTSVGFAYTSATREALVGGDLIDSWRAGEQRGWFLIADVSGKGIEAARHSAFVQYAIRTLSAEYASPADVLGRFNELFLATFDDPGIFVVVFLGWFDARSSELCYASAGHSTAFVRRAHGLEQLAPTGPIIGIDERERYAERTIVLATGDTVVLATDGLTECRDESGEMLGDDGVGVLLRDGGEPQAICDRLVAEAKRRSRGDVTDDLAILVLRILDYDAATPSLPFSTMTS